MRTLIWLFAVVLTFYGARAEEQAPPEPRSGRPGQSEPLPRGETLSQQARTELERAQAQIERAKNDYGRNDKKAVQKDLETAKEWVRKDDFHSGQPRAMLSKHQLDMAIAAVESNRDVEAHEHIRKAGDQLTDLLAEKPIHPDTQAAGADRQPYLEGWSGIRPQSELQTEIENKKKELAGEPSKRTRECPDCDQTTESGEWMKGARETGLGG